MVEGGVRTSAFIAFMLAPVSSIAMPIVPTVTVSELQEAFEWLGAGRIALVFFQALPGDIHLTNDSILHEKDAQTFLLRKCIMIFRTMKIYFDASLCIIHVVVVISWNRR